jgi:5'-deoxynucleotidase YfbR-like HD superfamily hydrolase
MKLLHEMENLKRLPRAGWKIKNIPNPESVAEHSFRLAIMTFFAPVRHSCRCLNQHLRPLIGSSESREAP